MSEEQEHTTPDRETDGTDSMVTRHTFGMPKLMQLPMEDRRGRERGLRAQMEMLWTLVEAGTRREAEPTASGRSSSSEDKVKLSKLTETDDVEAYLMTFERMIAAYEAPESQWPF